MTADYKVEFEALARLVVDLAECADGMRSAMRKMKDIGPKGAGSADLEQACDDFQEKWDHGIGLIADATSGIAEKVAQSGRLFQGLEDEISGLVSAVKVVDKTMRSGDR